MRLLLVLCLVATGLAQPLLLSVARSALAGAGVGSKAIFGGGLASGAVATVDVCDTNGCMELFPGLTVARYSLAAVALGSKAIFAGGYDGSSVRNEVDACDVTGCLKIATLNTARSVLSGASTGTKAFFGGGSAGGTPSTAVDVCDTSGCAHLSSGLSEGRALPAAAAIGNSVIFAGGNPGTGSYSTVIDICTPMQCTRATFPISTPVFAAAGAAINGGAAVIFAGGTGSAGGSYSAAADRCTTAGCTKITALSVERQFLAAGTDGTNAFFGGGDHGLPQGTVDLCSTSGCAQLFPGLSDSRTRLAAASVGSLVFFGGGSSAAGASAAVDYCSANTGCQQTVLTGGGDPSFVGFNGQRFGFHGKPNHSFHIYSDPYVSLNARFVIANPSTNKGTVMDAVGVRWENHTVTFGINSVAQNKTAVWLSVDGNDRVLPRSKLATSFDDCIKIAFRFPNLIITTPLHRIVVSWREEHTAHINTTYLNFRLSIPIESEDRYGGVLGQTAAIRNVTLLSHRIADFATNDDLMSTDAKSSKFTAQPLLCAASAMVVPSSAHSEYRHSALETRSVGV